MTVLSTIPWIPFWWLLGVTAGEMPSGAASSLQYSQGLVMLSGFSSKTALSLP